MRIKPEIEATLPNEVVTSENVFIGAKVMRGPDWRYDDQDGGAGSIGVITELHNFVGAAYVEWSSGRAIAYHIGLSNKYDLIFAK